jgi:hypothetical protein
MEKKNTAARLANKEKTAQPIWALDCMKTNWEDKTIVVYEKNKKETELDQCICRDRQWFGK